MSFKHHIAVDGTGDSFDISALLRRPNACYLCCKRLHNDNVSADGVKEMTTLHQACPGHRLWPMELPDMEYQPQNNASPLFLVSLFMQNPSQAENLAKQYRRVCTMCFEHTILKHTACASRGFDGLHIVCPFCLPDKQRVLMRTESVLDALSVRARSRVMERLTRNAINHGFSF